MSTDPARALRADARNNRDRLLDAAARAFAKDGADASLKAIAADAGVGIGTLYRRFPTREQLIEAVYRNESARLAATADELLATSPPEVALRDWMELFLDHMAAEHAMAAALRAVLVSDGDLRMETRDLLTGALARLLDAGVATGVITARVDPHDVLMALGGASMIAGDPDQRDQAHRILDLLMGGLTRRS